MFHFGYCEGCDLGLVLDPRTDFEALYDEHYYHGRGADPLMRPHGWLCKHLEFQALEATVHQLNGHAAPGRWLDFGGGTGDFSQYLRGKGWDAWAVDEGYAGKELAQRGLLWDGLSPAGFDVVSAIEVMEHLLDPVPVLRRMAEWLTPGGLLIITTGNLSKARNLASWGYAKAPEVHVTFWSPRSWARALALAGFQPTEPVAFDPMLTQQKIIKHVPGLTVPLAYTSRWWRGLARALDAHYGVSGFPAGRKR